MLPRSSGMCSESVRWHKWFAMIALTGSVVTGCAANPPHSSTASRLAIRPAPDTLPDKNAELEQEFVGHPAPSLTGLRSLDGRGAPEWSSWRGRVVVLDFWAPWCGVCHLVAEDLNRWQERYGEHISVVGIAVGSVEHIARQATRFHMQYPTLADPSEQVSEAYHAQAVPLIIVVNQTGVVRAVTLGYSSARMINLEKLVAQLLLST